VQFAAAGGLSEVTCEMFFDSGGYGSGCSIRRFAMHAGILTAEGANLITPGAKD